jgi:hypothetical protein
MNLFKKLFSIQLYKRKIISKNTNIIPFDKNNFYQILSKFDKRENLMQFGSEETLEEELESKFIQYSIIYSKTNLELGYVKWVIDDLFTNNSIELHTGCFIKKSLLKKFYIEGIITVLWNCYKFYDPNNIYTVARIENVDANNLAKKLNYDFLYIEDGYNFYRLNYNFFSSQLAKRVIFTNKELTRY